MKDQHKQIDPPLKCYVCAHCKIIDNDVVSKEREEIEHYAELLVSKGPQIVLYDRRIIMEKVNTKKYNWAN